MTQAKLIDYCNTIPPERCHSCRHKKECERYSERFYADVPYMDNIRNPHRYSEIPI